MSNALQYDGQLWVSLGTWRKDTAWKSRQLPWSQLVDRLSKTQRTDETFKEYMAFTKDQQAAKKDVGGFVGGIITGGRRLSKAIQSRSLITLDIDYETKDFWDTYKLIFDNAAVIYSTHKHSPQMPRLRLVLPLDKEYFPDQYQAIARKIASLLDIEVFDDSTFQPERLMYWPSTPKDGEFFFDHQDGPFLNGEAYLNRYRNWKDSSQWPTSSRVRDTVKRSAEKQGDPLEKPGVIGAFCRTYAIAEAIEGFLSDVYEATDKDDRFTFMGGSTAAGLILYDDKFAYSHHGTDPISGKLCNAFDLVRIHLYGSQDEEIDAATPMNKRPSYTAMSEFAVKDAAVSKELSLTRLAEAGFVFDELAPEEMNWVEELTKSRDGKAESTIHNTYLILKNDPYLKECFAYNLFEHRDVLLKDLPWRSIKKAGEFMVGDDDACLRSYIEKNWGIASESKVRDAFRQLMVERGFHPIRTYLEGLTWDGKERIDTLLIDYFGAEDNEYTRTVTRKTLLGAVSRVFEPGVKFDTMLVLVGTQGKGKSAFLAKLGQGWFSDSFGPLDNLTRAMEQIQGAWIIEVAELAGFKKSDTETIKHFIAKQEDRFRAAYAVRTEHYPRQCIFIGTTNKEDFLNDSTGDRRFWPVQIEVNTPTRNVWRDLTAGEIRQVWAEAHAAYVEGETLYLGAELEIESRKIKEKHTEEDERSGLIGSFLDKLVPEDWEHMSLEQRREFIHGNAFGGEPEKKGTKRMYKVSPVEIWCELFANRLNDANSYKLKFIRDYMDRLQHWDKRMLRTWSYGRQRGYMRKSGVKELDSREEDL